MKKIEQIIYVAMDGEVFTSEEECLAYEKLTNVPADVILMDNDFERIVNTEDIDVCYFAFLPTKEDAEWFREISKAHGTNASNVVAGEHLWYDSDEEIWCSYEQAIKEAQERLQKFEKFAKS